MHRTRRAISPRPCLRRAGGLEQVTLSHLWFGLQCQYMSFVNRTILLHLLRKLSEEVGMEATTGPSATKGGNGGAVLCYLLFQSRKQTWAIAAFTEAWSTVPLCKSYSFRHWGREKQFEVISLDWKCIYFDFSIKNLQTLDGLGRIYKFLTSTYLIQIKMNNCQQLCLHRSLTSTFVGCF